jgi:pimeloyl-ACP methyl ester carboxylesterase
MSPGARGVAAAGRRGIGRGPKGAGGMTARPLAAPREDIVSIAGCRTFVMRGGEGPPLLYLHAARGGAWLPFLERLARRFHVVAPEHPGFGRSETPAWLDDIHDLAYFTLDLMEALGLSGTHVVGASLGGWIAAEAAVRSTARMASLTLVGPAGLRVKGIPRTDIFLVPPEEAAAAMFHDPRLAAALAVDPEDDAAVERALKNRQATARLAWAPRAHDPQLAKWLHRIGVPTLIAWGREDRFLPAEYAEHWTAKLPRAEMLVLENCGHFPTIERAETMADAIEEFVARAAP